MTYDDEVDGAGWWGRVFTDDVVGGNHTAIVFGGDTGLDLAALAAELAVPDTGFVVGGAQRTVRLRTFSPVEELAQCFQTSMAVLTALDVPDDEPWVVQHDDVDPLVVWRCGPTTWARPARPVDPVVDTVAWPAAVPLTPGSGADAVVVRQARSRVYLRCADADELDAVHLRPETVLALCRSTGTNGLVLTAPVTGDAVRARVFTTSLAGHEDSGTGGAILGLGILLAAAGERGELTVVQGPSDPVRQGRLRLQLGADRTVTLGGEVRELMRGTLTRAQVRT